MATDAGFYWFNLYLPRNVPQSLRFKRRFYKPDLAKKALFYYWVINFKGFRTPAINQPDSSFTSMGDVSARVPTTYLKLGLLFLEHDSERCGESEIRGAGQIYVAQSGLPAKAIKVSFGGRTKVARLPNISGKLVTVYLGLVRYMGFVQPFSLFFEPEFLVDARVSGFTVQRAHHTYQSDEGFL